MFRVTTGKMIVQNYVQKRLMDADATVVLDESQLSEPIHEEAHTRACSSNHFGQRLLRDLWNQRLRLAGLTKLCHQQQDSGQPLFTGVEKLVDKIGLCANTPCQ